MVHGFDHAAATLLRTRALLRLGSAEEALGEVDKLHTDELNEADYAEACILRALAQLTSDPSAAIDGLLIAARAKAVSDGNVVHEAEAEYVMAASFFGSGRFPEAIKSLELLLGMKADRGPWSRKRHTVYSLEEHRARAYDLLGHIASRQQRFGDQLHFLRLVFVELDRSISVDRYIEARALANLSEHAKDRDEEGLYEFVRRRVEQTTFSGSTRVLEFEIRRNLGTCAATRGDHIGALRDFRYSADIAPSVASRIKAIVDRASLARELSESTFANDESDFALTLAKQVDWSTVLVGDIFALLALARNLSARNPANARQYFERYMACKKRLTLLNSKVGDLGLVGQEYETEALIARSEGSPERSVVLNLDAFNLYKRVGMVWRAATVAVELFEVTGECAYLEYARRYAVKVPQSHLARRLGQLATNALS
jgi:tetratricopeptide (TPR) repeat protein